MKLQGSSRGERVWCRSKSDVIQQLECLYSTYNDNNNITEKISMKNWRRWEVKRPQETTTNSCCSGFDGQLWPGWLRISTHSRENRKIKKQEHSLLLVFYIDSTDSSSKIDQDIINMCKRVYVNRNVIQVPDLQSCPIIQIDWRMKNGNLSKYKFQNNQTILDLADSILAK